MGTPSPYDSVGVVFDFVSAGLRRSAHSSFTAFEASNQVPRSRGHCSPGLGVPDIANNGIRIMRYPTKWDLCLGAVGAALWAAVFLLPAYPRAMPLSAFEAIAEAAKPPRLARPVELPPLQREQRNRSRTDRQRELDCLAVDLFSQAQGEPSAARITVASVTLDGLAHQRFSRRPCDVAGSRASSSSTDRRY